MSSSELVLPRELRVGDRLVPSRSRHLWEVSGEPRKDTIDGIPYVVVEMTCRAADLDGTVATHYLDPGVLRKVHRKKEG